MSTATHFKHIKPLPFCIEQMTGSAIDALGFIRLIQGTLADVMSEIWNREAWKLGLSGITEEVFAVYPLADNGGASSSTQPRERVCAEVDLSDGTDGAYAPLAQITDTIDDGTYDLRIRAIYRSVVYDTDASEYVLLFTLQATASDGLTAIYTTDSADPDLTTTASGYADIFASGPGVYSVYYDSGITPDFASYISIDDPSTASALWSY